MTREERDKAIEYFKKVEKADSNDVEMNMWNLLKYSKLVIEALQKEPCGDTGEISDGYHTFNQLYHQRAILFATIVNQNADIAWKSYKHSDGKYCFDSNGEWFIVGIDTPEGSYTYHYSKEYWDYFKCKELECGKEWDGHTEEDVTRLLSLKKESCADAVNRDAVIRIAEQGQVQGYEWQFKKLVMLPPVTPQPKIGHWITTRTIMHDGEYYCDRCNCDAPNNKKWDYCPNCGAEIEEVEE